MSTFACYSLLLLQSAAVLFVHSAVPVNEPGIETYENYLDGVYLEDENAGVELRNALPSPRQHWPERTLYYRISPDYTAEEAANVHQAVGYFKDHTCLVFEEYDADKVGKKRYLHYTKSKNMCGTKVGYQPGTATTHEVVLNENCLRKVGVIQHETLHVLGLYHEQSRPDRNDYVHIEYNNIAPKYWSQFSSYAHTTTYDVPYDYESLMHYSAYAFAKDSKKPTMRARDGKDIYDRNMGQTNGPSEGDLKKINIMYNC